MDEPKGATAVGAGVATAGAMTMIALCFANGLQGGMSTTFSQATEALKHTFHINDFTLAFVPAGVTIVGNFGAIPVAHYCARYKRTLVLAAMFILWAVLIGAAAASPSFRLFGLASAGFAVFGVFRVSAALLEATDPAVYPLIADWWRHEDRAKRVSVFNTLAGVGAFAGLGLSGVLVDNVGWRWAFAVWVPLGFLGTYLIRRQREPQRGAEDAAYKARLAEATDDEEKQQLLELVDSDAPVALADVVADVGGWREVVRSVARLRSWRMAALGLAISGIMGGGIMTWGIAYFKRTFHLSSTGAAGLAPIIGAGAFFGVLAGGFLADRLLARGMRLARLYVTAGGMFGAGVFYMCAFSTTHLLVAAPFLAVASTCSTLPMGPQFAFMMDTTPARLRSQASAALNVLQASGFVGPLLVGGLSTLFGENLRLALFCVSPFYIAGAIVVLAARRTYVEDLALVVAEASAIEDSDDGAG